MPSIIMAIMMAITNLFALPTVATAAPQVITIQGSSSAAQSSWVPYRKMLDIANQQQNKYQFVLEHKPGAFGLLALQAMDASPHNRLATVSNGLIDNIRQGRVDKKNYVALSSHGDACWAIITNVGDERQGLISLKGQKDIMLGTVGHGSSAHITALELGAKYGFKVTVVAYKSNMEALVNMVGGHSINMVVERVSAYQQFKSKNPDLKILGMNCSTRHPSVPDVKTLSEQGVEAPSIWIVTAASVNMPADQRQEIADILDSATGKLGRDFLISSADMMAPMFFDTPMSASAFYDLRVQQTERAAEKWHQQIEASR